MPERDDNELPDDFMLSTQLIYERVTAGAYRIAQGAVENREAVRLHLGPPHNELWLDLGSRSPT
ncbi:hypothetical protein BJZ21_003309 [Nocardioides panaciterrulae]|uniref:Uncharacterized protein n=1 Tax=Nocardioides panaciterrulae TaxID=661492 RepID=A0A7Y9E8L3_9ACTN|nr:hypothetical protein [Nocardioides panaciterrulae]